MAVASNEPTAIDIVIYKGSLWHFGLPVLDADEQLIVSTAGLTARAQIRARADAAPLFTFTDVVLNPDTKQVELRILGSVSAVWTWRTGIWECDVLDPGGEPHTIAAGAARTRENIAR